MKLLLLFISEYSSEDLGFRISELHRRLSSFVGTVHETAILSCNVEDVMKVMSGRPFKCADPVLVRTIDSVMEAYYEFSWGKVRTLYLFAYTSQIAPTRARIVQTRIFENCKY